MPCRRTISGKFYNIVTGILLALNILGGYISIPLVGKSSTTFVLIFGKLPEDLRQCRAILPDVLSVATPGETSLNLGNTIRIYASTHGLWGPRFDRSWMPSLVTFWRCSRDMFTLYSLLGLVLKPNSDGLQWRNVSKMPGLCVYAYLFKLVGNRIISLRHSRLNLLGNRFDNFRTRSHGTLTFPLHPCLRGVHENGLEIILDPVTRHCVMTENY
jgi:hypothetical protein